MKLVEICGPSGIGKTTIYQAMRRRGMFANTLAPRSDAPEADARALAVRHGDVAEFVELLDQVLATAPDARRFHAWNSLYKALYYRDGLGAVAVPGCLTQLGDTLRSEVPIEDYYRAMPVPDMVVMLHARPETIMRRNNGRGEDRNRSADAERSTEAYAFARRVLIERGVRVKRLSAERSVDENVRRIRAMMRGL